MRRGSTLFQVWFALMVFVFCPLGLPSAERGVIAIKDPQGREVGLYQESHALLIGISDYSGGWPDLESVPVELKRVKAALEAQGFQVVSHLDLDSAKLREVVLDFINAHGLERNNRLLFFFAGHGHTVTRGYGVDMGYIVPADAPDPRTHRSEFLGKAVSMDQVLTWARDIEAKHALFLFDSCFSGSVFAERDLPEVPPHISDLTSEPVRQFITAGKANQPVPAQSIFARLFVDALEHGLGDIDKDGFITATELGMYLQRKVPEYENQNPQYGKIRYYPLARGDFVFALRQPTQAMPAPKEATAKLTVRSNVYDDTVYIDGKRRGSTRLDVDLEAGWHTVRVEKAGYAPYEEQIELRAGETSALRAELRPGAETSVPSTGRPPAQKSWTEPTTDMEFVWLPPGCFQMGSPEGEAGRRSDEHQHEACVEGFWLGKYEVTNAQYRRFHSGHRSGEYKGHSLDGDDQPVVEVSWQDAVAFAEWLSERSGERFRLPTEAEWEYAVRARTATARYWGEDPAAACAYANVRDETSQRRLHFTGVHACDDGFAVTAPVGRFRPNDFGLHDLLGNVWEWTCSEYNEAYGGEEGRCVDKAASGSRVLRGGSWSYWPPYVRAALRGGYWPESRYDDLGFRLARTP